MSSGIAMQKCFEVALSSKQDDNAGVFAGAGGDNKFVHGLTEVTNNSSEWFEAAVV